jgi:hypothetical protein
VKDLILEKKPKLIVECGMALGDNTKKILGLSHEYPFKLITISDMPDKDEVNLYVSQEWDNKFYNFEYRQGISYKEFENFKDSEIDFCLIDTDHNYWTLKQELEALHKKLAVKGVIVMHDTQSYRKDPGGLYPGGYKTKDVYPEDEILIYSNNGKAMGHAIFEFLADRHEYIVLKEVTESHGAMALEKICE